MQNVVRCLAADSRDRAADESFQTQGTAGLPHHGRMGGRDDDNGS
jgi:hypothetical protein